MINLKTEEGVRQFEAIAEEVAELVLKYGGALSGEHGDGLVRSPFQEKMYGPVLYQAFRELKRTFDPHNLLNPGKIVDAPPLATNLRYGPGYVTPDGGDDVRLLGRRRPAAGRRALRGRRRLPEEARGDDVPLVPGDPRREATAPAAAPTLLRLAITGQLGFAGFTDPHVHEVLDLCLECKACKGECPTNVDMARLKAEFLHQYYREHGLPLAQPGLRPRRRAGPDRQRAGAGVELAGAEPARAAGSTRSCWGSTAAASRRRSRGDR